MDLAHKILPYWKGPRSGNIFPVQLHAPSLINRWTLELNLPPTAFSRAQAPLSLTAAVPGSARRPEVRQGAGLVGTQPY